MIYIYYLYIYIYLLSDGGSQNELGHAHANIAVEGQGRRRDEHRRVALVSEPQCDHCGSSHGQREFYEAFREWVQVAVSIERGFWRVHTRWRMRNIAMCFLSTALWHTSPRPQVYGLTCFIWLPVYPRHGEGGGVMVEKTLCRWEINLLFSICCRRRFMQSAHAIHTDTQADGVQYVSTRDRQMLFYLKSYILFVMFARFFITFIGPNRRLTDCWHVFGPF